jgi:hypothetical protein
MGKTWACIKLTVTTCLSYNITGTVTFMPDMEKPIRLAKVWQSFENGCYYDAVTQKLHWKACQLEKKQPQHCNLHYRVWQNFEICCL